MHQTPHAQLRANNLAIGYGETILAQDLELQLKAGQFICLIGVNGAGKSTLIRSLCGLQQPLAGNLYLNDVPIHQIPTSQRSKELGVVLTERILVGHLSVESLIALGRSPHTGWFGRLSREDQTSIENAIEQTGLQELRRRDVCSLSDGQRQKVMIARVLAQQTPLVILDEPTAFLDLVQRVEIATLLKQLAHQQGHGILMSTHDLELALRIADQVWMFDASRQLHMGTPEDLILNNAFQHIFESKHLHFDSESGRFQITKQTEKPVSLSAKGRLYTWTKHALERRGYVVSEERQPSVSHIEATTNQEQHQWIVSPPDGLSSKASSISSMLEYLEASA